MISDSIENFCQEMYDGYGFSQATGLKYFSTYLDQAKKFGEMQVFAFQSKKYPLRHVLDFWLSSPTLWDGYSSEDWLELMKVFSPRPDSSRWIDQDRGYADIVFLCRYMHLNGLAVYCRSPLMPFQDKMLALNHFKCNRYSLLLDELDDEDLDGEYFVSADKLSEVKKRLLEEKVFSEFTCSDEQELKVQLLGLDKELEN